MKASEIANYIGQNLVGEDIEITGVCSLRNPKRNALAFYKFDEPFESKEMVTVLVKPNISCKCKSYISVKNPRFAHAMIVSRFFSDPNTAIPVGDGCLRDHRYVGVTIYDCVEWGEDCFFKPGVVLGGSGFGFENDKNGVPIRRPHVGKLKLGNGVEVGSNSVIDRGTLDDTILGNNVKIDSLVLVGHNCIVGENTQMATGVRLSGSVTIGKNCWLGTGSIIKNQVKIGDNVTIGVGAIVVKDVPNGSVLAGFKAQSIERMRRMANAIERD